MYRLLLVVAVAFLYAGCDSAADEADYWWLDDPAFADILDEIDVEATLAANHSGIVVLKSVTLEGDAARQSMIDRYGHVAYHDFIYHPEKFAERKERFQVLLGDSTGFEQTPGDSAGVWQEEPCPCFAGCVGPSIEYCDCDHVPDGGSGGPPPEPPYELAVDSDLYDVYVNGSLTSVVYKASSNANKSSKFEHNQTIKVNGTKVVSETSKSRWVFSYESKLSASAKGDICSTGTFVGNTFHKAQYDGGIFLGIENASKSSGATLSGRNC